MKTGRSGPSFTTANRNDFSGLINLFSIRAVPVRRMARWRFIVDGRAFFKCSTLENISKAARYARGEGE